MTPGKEARGEHGERGRLGRIADADGVRQARRSAAERLDGAAPGLGEVPRDPGTTRQPDPGEPGGRVGVALLGPVSAGDGDGAAGECRGAGLARAVRPAAREPPACASPGCR